MEKSAGTKVMVWDKSLMEQMDMVFDIQFFKKRGVIKNLILEGGKLPKLVTDNVIFITRPGKEQMDNIADNIKGEEVSRGLSFDFRILFVPKKSYLCENRLQEKGVFGSITSLDELPLSWFPLDTDVVSMERPGIFSDFHIKNDPTCLYEMAKALINLQALYGFAPKIYGKGDAAKKLFEYMSKIKREMAAAEPDTVPQFDTIILLDRKVDMITPFLTQLTYEGLIDEFSGIKNGHVKLPNRIFSNPEEEYSSEALTKIPLNSENDIYSELRDKNFNAACTHVRRKVRELQNLEAETKKGQTVKEMKEAVSRLESFLELKKSIDTHTRIAVMIKEKTDGPAFREFLQIEQELVNNQNVYRLLDFIEDAACQEMDMLGVLRIACLQCALSQGLKPKFLETYRRVILQAYGYHHITGLINLEKSNLLYSYPSPASSSSYSILRKRLNLTQDDVNEQDPSDITYVHSCYAPMSVRLVQNCAKPGWRAIRETLDLIPCGPSFEEYQTTKKKPNPDLKRTLVVFIGGCTYAEISALRFLSQQEDAPTEYSVATTSMINGNSLLESVMTPSDGILNF